MKITHCPPGFAYGYIPVNGSTLLSEFEKDIGKVAEPMSVMGAMARNEDSGYADKVERSLAGRAKIIV